MSVIPRTKPSEDFKLGAIFLGLLLAVLSIPGWVGFFHGKSFFGSLYDSSGTQYVLVLLILGAAFGAVRLTKSLARRLRSQKLRPEPDGAKKDSLTWLSWLLIAALYLWPPIWWMRYRVWRRKRQLARDIPERPPVSVV